MYKVTMEIEVKKDTHARDAYEELSRLIRLFIDQNDKELKEKHYHSVFSYYSFSNMHPFEKDLIYKAGKYYVVELRSLHKEFLDMKMYQGLETEAVSIADVSSTKLFYHGSGEIQTETPLFMNNKPLSSKDERDKLIDLLRENIVFRYLKSGMNQNDDIAFVRSQVVEKIEVTDRLITVPFSRKKLKDGSAYRYHCYHAKVFFHDNDVAKEVEKVLYAGGIGKNTSNGFGFIR
ncbi:hypothetical protein [Metabacillus hrfriensis]|uniref:Uncharacterized protein n=1 Tax=Metabacillus hrfriensis TaxID=3048891 RepID=A0ACD4RID0_9BACI|nr:hypothetical protein [Metabacillus sp. CT-WN-B3]WHZ60083.1 hypothetical protein QLQ22_12440 [Metabacillus sp. CT-WN-B3]